MSYSADDLAALETAIATGARSVQFADGRRVDYRTLDEMLKIKGQMEASLGLTTTITGSGTLPSAYFRD